MTCKIGWKKGTFRNQWQSSETHGLWKPPRSKLRPATGLSGRGVWSWRLMQPSPWSQLGEYTLQIFSHREDKHLKSLLQGNSQACSVLIYFQIAFQWNFKKYLNPVSRSCPHSSDDGDWWGRRFFLPFQDCLWSRWKVDQKTFSWTDMPPINYPSFANWICTWVWVNHIGDPGQVLPSDFGQLQNWDVLS